MPFNTYTFVVFFALLLGAYYALRDWRAQKILLLAASYLFYAAWNPAFVLLLLFSTVADWLAARRIAAAAAPATRHAWLVVSLAVNLGLLGYFKYGDFLLENVAFGLGFLGLVYQPPASDIVLPVGISFYTFQTLSYTLDVYRNKIGTEPSFLNYALYVSFFPQLVAGPIVRAGDFLPQCTAPRRASSDQFGWGLGLLLSGLFMKVVMADTVFAPVVDKVYADPWQAGQTEAWTAVFAFSGQIYCDFAGYSTCAVGAALCLGFILPDNFRYPYGASGFREFWGRWHISLSTWLRDYLYVSLGGNRLSLVRTNVNVMITMLIGGLWHGASWLFVLWGGLHGLYIVLENVIGKYAGAARQRSKGTRGAAILLTWLVISVTWIFFRAHTLDDAAAVLSGLFSDRIPLVLNRLEMQVALLGSLGLFTWHLYMRGRTLEDFIAGIPIQLRVGIFSCLLLSLFLFGAGDDRAFIYFQF